MQAFVEGIRAIIQASPGMRQDYYIVESHGVGFRSIVCADKLSFDEVRNTAASSGPSLQPNDVPGAE